MYWEPRKNTTDISAATVTVSHERSAIRMLETFSEECIEKITSVTLACGTVLFKTEARTTLREG